MAIERPRVLLALSSPSLLERLYRHGSRSRGTAVLDTATNGAQAASMAADLQPQVVLCDEPVLRHPAMRALFASGPDRPACRLALIAEERGRAAIPDLIPISAVLESSMDANTLWQQISLLMAPLEPRFSAPPPAGSAQLLRRIEIPSVPSASAAEPAKVPRTEDPLSTLLQTIQREAGYPRDPVTGVATSPILHRVLAALPALEQPAAVAVIAIWSGPAAAPAREDRITSSLRTIAATLRAHVRHGDLVCRLEEQAFAIVLSHPPSQAPRIPSRLRTALDEVRHSSLADRSGLVVSVGFGFWEPGLPATHPLEQAWRAAMEERDRGSVPPLPGVPPTRQSIRGT